MGEHVKPDDRDIDFNDAFITTLGYEGGLNETEVGQGGKSNHGITQATYDVYNERTKKEKRDVSEATLGDARDIAYDDYYALMRLPKLKNTAIKKVLFDYGFSSGPGTAIKSLQEVVGAKVDGILGPKTIKKMQKYSDDNGEDGLIDALLSSREEHLQNLVTNDPETYGRFQEGWGNRLQDLRSKVLP